LVTCKEFLSELNEYLDGSVETGLRGELERHLGECPNCWVVCDTTKKTIQIYRGVDPYPMPAGVHDRLLAVLHKKTQTL
jgi:anti-sigma factor RsiW